MNEVAEFFTIRNKTAYDPHVSCIISEQNIYLVVHSRPFSQAYLIILSVFKRRIQKCFLYGHYSTWGDGSKNPKLWETAEFRGVPLGHVLLGRIIWRASTLVAAGRWEIQHEMLRCVRLYARDHTHAWESSNASATPRARRSLRCKHCGKMAACDTGILWRWDRAFLRGRGLWITYREHWGALRIIEGSSPRNN